MGYSCRIRSYFNDSIRGDKIMGVPAWHKIIKKKDQSTLDDHAEEEEEDDS